MTDPKKWLIEAWLESFSQVLRSMVDDRPTLTISLETAGDLGDAPVLIEQKFGPSPDPLLWIGAPEETWRDLGSRVLQAAGVETVSDEESRNTCLEILQQAVGGLAQAITAQLQREVAALPAREPSFFPEGLTPTRVVVQYGDRPLPAIWFAVAPLLAAWMEQRPETAAPAPAAVTAESSDGPSFAGSRTFDLLLDVSLPVSISFGKTELAVKDVLKLTTGSIVELDRAVSEPVDVIVNNCVIARGEVVVVEGNYGVRIHQIVSRQERLKTGSSTAAVTRG